MFEYSFEEIWFKVEDMHTRLSIKQLVYIMFILHANM